MYSTLVNVSGLMKTSEETEYPTLLQGRLPKHLAGFLFPNQIATLMLGEVEDLMSVLAPALYPIFGAVMTLRYPTQPLRLVSVGNASRTIVS